MRIEADVPLAPLTTLRLGGSARRLAHIEREAELLEALADAEREGSPVLALGGGSNLVVADDGWPGTVLKIEIRGIACERRGERVTVRVGAGEPWHEVVERSLQEGWVGLECLAGIPGSAGATPIQNVGAYGREVGEVLVSVRAWDRQQRAFATMQHAACCFSYRHSLFKAAPQRYIVCSMELQLGTGGQSEPIRYGELSRALGLDADGRAPVRLVGDTVVALRRAKGMVVDPADPESVSAGSYFTNPLLDGAQWQCLQDRVRQLVGDGEVPAWRGADGTWKVAAAWLIEQAGFAKGYTRQGVGISRRHALSLVNRGGSTRALLELEREIVQGVVQRFGVTLTREPVLARFP
jgi:UDP-N-acetylmuramate dehydrogenase